MTKNRFDQFSKQLLDEVLSPLGTVEKSLEVLGEPRWVDLYFTPSPQSATEAQNLGLLGRMAVTPCLLDPFRNPPTTTEVRDCLLKLFSVCADRQRQAHRQKQTLSDTDLPKLWILASSVSSNLLENYGAIPVQSWPPGVYWMAPAFNSTLVSINQLPETADTLWLRLLGKGTTQERAINEVLSLSATDPSRRPGQTHTHAASTFVR